MKLPWYMTITEWHQRDGVAWLTVKVSRWVLPFLYARELVRMARVQVNGS